MELNLGNGQQNNQLEVHFILLFMVHSIGFLRFYI